MFTSNQALCFLPPVCTSSCLFQHFEPLQTLPPSVWSIPNPVGAGRGCAGLDGWEQWPQSPSQRAVCGFGPFSSQLLFHRSFNPVRSPSGIPSRGSQWRGWLSPGSCQLQLLWIPHSPLHPPGPPRYPGCPSPGVGVPALHSSEVPHFLFFSSFFWQDSRTDLRPGSLEEPQHMDSSEGREVRADRHRSPMELSGEERKSKGHLCCKWGGRGEDCLLDVDHFLLLGIASDQYLCPGRLSCL